MPTCRCITGDEDRLVQVLTNLLDNAVKYTPEEDTITVAAHGFALAHRTPTDRAGCLNSAVTDTGIGIPEAGPPRVFERFYRVDKARSRELGGTGLGLAIVKHIVEGHGGQVWVEGNVPQGSRFVVRLPVPSRKTGTQTSTDNEQHRSPPPEQPSSRQGKDPRIENFRRHPPPHRGKPFDRADAHDRTR